METFAYIQTAVAYEDPNPDPELRSLEELGLTVPSSAGVGLAGIMLSASMLLNQIPNVQAAPVIVRSPVGLNIRSGPGDDFPVIGGLRDGQAVEVINASDGWYQLASGGWIASGFTSGTSFTSTTSFTSIGSGVGGGGTPTSGIVTVSPNTGVNIRSGPGTDFPVIGGLSPGEQVQIVSLSNGFYQLSSGGWISSAYASRAFSSGGGGVPVTSAVAATPASGTVTVTASGVNIRSGPSTAFPVIGGLGRGAQVQIISFSNGFYQLASGGWISSAFTSRGSGGGGGGGTPTTATSAGFVTVRTGSGLNIRSGPSTVSPVIGVLGNGQRVQVISSSNGFYQLASGGWIAAAYTSAF